MDEFDDAAARDLLRPLDGEPRRPSTVEIEGLLRAGRRRVRRRRLLAGGGLAASTAMVLVAVPVTFAAVRDGEPAVPGRDPGSVAQPGPAPGSPTSADRPGAAPKPPPAPTRCTPHRLPLPPGATESQVLDGDPSGRYLVGVARNSRTARTWVLRWDRGVLTVLEPPAADPGRLLVNSRGVVAGDGVAVRAGKAVPVSWVYRDGRYLDLTGSDGSHLGDVMDLNERGDVLGGVRTFGYQGEPAGTKGGPPQPPEGGAGTPGGSSASPGGGRTEGHPDVPGSNPVVWPAGAERNPTRLAGDGTGTPYATGIDDDGTVVGGIGGPGTDLPARTTVWAPDGTTRDLPPPPRHAATTSNLSIRGGWVLGWSVAPPGGEQKVVPTRWDLRTGKAAPLTGLAWVAAVNRHGWVAGFVRDAAGVETPAVLAGKRPLVLPSPAGAVPGTEGPSAVSVSDDGRVVGGLVSVAPADAATAAVRWTCE
ncbi:hypothetical protein O7626_38890 [Micromonospora sp. WMMD1102]|uniref:hypothetical protein n=1 Tax=Micromonospora sp. WMMD1102 TaxID=3016105 RepID=UPI0024157189|nr:hypothetical protein [Micromonospora sp. WMMD1102]MDG4791785.1 hypothetical protein [Micromonospora sp. WMMD1102]